MLWDLFCRVIDNYGDIGFCWRLSADLASRGEEVRLWVDDPSPLSWMAPLVHPGVKVLRWTGDTEPSAPGDIVIEAFGCDPPPAFVSRMTHAARPPVWINLEYLSAETYVERSHGLPSPQSSGPGAGLVKWFYYPGFTPATGGLLREPDLLERQRRFDAPAWRDRHGLRALPGERSVSLFCYDNPALPALIDALAERPTLLIAAAGSAATQVARALGPALARDSLRAVVLPPLAQVDYDHLLWSCDVNLVRGEDSFVRAQWAARPFVWQIYPQHDAAHAAKLEAFLDRFLAGANAADAEPLRAFWLTWNGLNSALPPLPPVRPWSDRCETWRDGLLAHDDLTGQLIRFASERR